jgi:hypothetical protein
MQENASWYMPSGDYDIFAAFCTEMSVEAMNKGARIRGIKVF